MRKLFLSIMLLLATVTLLPAQHTVKVTFTGGTTTGQHCPFTMVTATNVTRGWSETLVYPDTVLVMTQTGVDEHQSSRFGTAYPNPFSGETRVPLELSASGEVLLQAFRTDGSVVASCNMRLEAGTHNVTLRLAEPGLAFLTISTGQGRSVAKLVCIGNGGVNGIDVETVSTEFTKGGGATRGYATGEFVPGDVMRYEAILADGGITVTSAAVTQPQYNDETVTLRFAVSLPTVTTSEVTNVGPTSAFGGGDATFGGGLAVTAKGLCWSTDSNPTVNGFHSLNGSGTGSFTAQIIGLTASTTYFVRAYATNAVGTAYGDLKVFTTTQAPPGIILPTVTTMDMTDITETSAICGGTVTSNGNGTVTECGICWSTSQFMTVYGTLQSSSGGMGNFTVTMTDLTPGQTYYVRAYATNEAGTGYGEIKSFTTTAAPPVVTTPTVITSEATNITQTSATGGGTVISDGGATVTERGVCWNTTGQPTLTDSHTVNGSGLGSFASQMTGLTAGTTYYVRSYASNSEGIAYGNEVTFTTLAGGGNTTPTVTTFGVTNVTQTAAISGGNVTSDGGATVTSKGICWNTTGQPTLADSHTVNGSGMGSFVSQMTGLTAGTTYYVRAYASNSEGTAYGNEVTFTTIAGGGNTTPTVTTSDVTDVTMTEATCGGNVTEDGGAPVTERGICWNTTGEPTLADNHTIDGSGLGSFTSSLTGLNPAETYYVRAYASNSEGTAYGNEVTFTTMAGGGNTTPTVTTSDVTDVTMTEATCGGNVTEDGGAPVTERGICWNTTGEPTLADNYTIDGSGLGSFTSSLTGLNPAETYYVRAYASNSEGTAYGNEVTFTTMAVGGNTTPTVTTSDVTDVTMTEASCGGNVTDDGGAPVTERGICWNTTGEPTLADNYTIDGSGLGSFTSSLTGLNPAETYYVRAYASNSEGTAYGNEVTFTTQAAGPAAPEGAVNGLFSVSATQQVFFSMGNLQYNKSTHVWSFMEHQYDIAETNGDLGENYADQNIVSLFGWGTSGYNHGAVCYQPWCTSDAYTDYYAYGNSTYNLYDQTGQADWGYNAISNGGNTENQWRTLTYEEWEYVFNTRSTPSGMRYTKANVNNTNGVILLPDNWTAGTYPLNGANNENAFFNNNVITASQWTTLENAGAVFLPAAGVREGISVNYVGDRGYYWSASYFSFDYIWSCGVYFQDGSLGIDASNIRSHGDSVRLVCPAQ